MLDLDLNPKFTYLSPVHFDELDAMGMLHNSRFAAHVERAVIAYYHSLGRRWERNVSDNPDQFHVVKDFQIEFLSPVHSTEPVRIDVWVEHLGTTSCVYGFLCMSQDGRVPYARGRRTIIKLDPGSLRPTPWTDLFRRGHEELKKDLVAAP